MFYQIPNYMTQLQNLNQAGQSGTAVTATNR